MTEQTHIPHGKLTPYVKFIWYSHGYTPLTNKERVLPTGSSQLIINLGNEFFRHFEGPDHQEREYEHSLIIGIHSRYIFLDSMSRTSTMGVVFHPGGIPALFGVPANEFQDHVISLNDVIDSTLRERLAAAASPSAKFYLLESFLNKLLDKNFQVNPAITFTIQQMNDFAGQQSISEIADRTGYSRRRLSGLFKETAGIAPKEYARIQRFQNVLKEINMLSRPPDWSQFALSCRYYDQAHFNHDFKALSGLTPTQYFCSKTNETNHLPA